jgi:hypothetical protein
LAKEGEFAKIGGTTTSMRSLGISLVSGGMEEVEEIPGTVGLTVLVQSTILLMISPTVSQYGKCRSNSISISPAQPAGQVWQQKEVC